MKKLFIGISSALGFLSSGALPVYATCADKQADTAIGCIPTDPTGLANAVLSLSIGVAGGIAILFIIIGGLKVATSAGNPDQLEEARNTITAAIAGLVFILLAVSILAIIGVDILGIPALQRSGSGGVITPPIR